ncbi:MAG: ABC transporter substrate-binding protein [Halomonas sp.]|uniref:ABC transporter substrate-binding protein n=1 Tax=Halomonas sp. TaxID=1486246 RepID=UPI002ACDF510|nr:ABC transporter substrate-binding protein [Halomonas sp.]MDZ7852598.1 ABC transporter substrate-binding protein [Halomonas sp.]
MSIRTVTTTSTADSLPSSARRPASRSTWSAPAPTSSSSDSPREGADTPANLIITVDAGRLNRARERGRLQPVSSPRLSRQVPEHLRDDEGYWHGLTSRARVLVYHPGRVSVGELSTYEALAEPQWEGRIAVRSSSNIYNVSLLASLVAHHGARSLHEEWAARCRVEPCRGRRRATTGIR